MTGGRFCSRLPNDRFILRLILPLAFLVLLGTLLYAWFIEPTRIEVSQQVLGPTGTGDRPIRVVQLSDLHLQ